MSSYSYMRGYVVIFLCCVHGCTVTGYTRQMATISEMREVCYALKNFHGDTGLFPSTTESTDVLIINKGITGWHGPYLKKKYVVDGWGAKLNYYYPPVYGSYEYDLYSNGVNKENDFGNGDDIANWKISYRGSCDFRH